MKDSDRDVEHGLDCYDPETRVFPKITKKVSKRQGLSKRDLLLILKWKLGRIKGSNSETVSDDNLKKINEAIVDAGRPMARSMPSRLWTRSQASDWRRQRRC